MGLLNSLFGQKPVQAQTSMQPQSQGLLGNLSDPLVALPLAGALMQPGGFGQNLGQGFAMAGVGMAARKKLAKEELEQNATAKWLENQGADPGLVEMAKSGAGAQALTMYQAGKKDDGLMAVGKNLYDKGSRQWIMGPGGTGGDDTEYYGNPLFTDDGQGNIVPYQLGKNGVPKKVELPAGSKIAGGIQAVDTGTGYNLYDKRTGAGAGTLSKDVAGENAQKARGTAQGEAQYALPAAKLSADTAIAQADDLINDKYLPNMLGKTNSMKPNWSPESNRVQNKLDQLGGTAFLQARQALKGGGAITDMEGDQAKAALVRAGTAQSYDDFKTAIDEYKDHLRKGFEILEQQARGGGAAPQQGTTSTNVPFRVVQ